MDASTSKSDSDISDNISDHQKKRPHEEDVHHANSEYYSTPTKKCTAVASKSIDILSTGSTTIVQLNQKKTYYTEAGTLVAIVGAVTPNMESHKLVYKKRTRMVLIDKTGMLTAVCHQSPFSVNIGDVITVKNSVMEHGRLIIHQKTIVGRGPNINPDEKSLEIALNKLREPIRNYSAIGMILAINNPAKQEYSIRGYVANASTMTDVASPNYKTPSGRILRKEIDVEDVVNHKKISVTLWDESAMHVVSSGSTVAIHDSPLFRNETFHYNYLSVYSSDNIVIYPPVNTIETIHIVAIEPSTQPGWLDIIVKNKDTMYPRKLKRATLLENIPQEFYQYDTSRLRKLCPMKAKAFSCGKIIDRIVVHSYTDPEEKESIDFQSMFDGLTSGSSEEQDLMRELNTDFNV